MQTKPFMKLTIMSPFGLYEIKSKQFLEEGTTKNSFFIGDDTYNAR